MWRLLGAVILGMGLWGAGLVLPRSDRQQELTSLIGIAVEGDPLAYLGTPAEAAVGETPIETAAPAASAVTIAATAPETVPVAGSWSVVDNETAELGEDDQVGLATRLQQELRRIGCYTGPVDGKWGSRSRRAARAFAAAIDASLVTREPDAALLMLAEKYENRACGAPCEAGFIPNDAGQCIRSRSIEVASRTEPTGSEWLPLTALDAAQDAVSGAGQDASPPLPESLRAETGLAQADEEQAGEAAPVVADIVTDQDVAALGTPLEEGPSVFIADDAFVPRDLTESDKARQAAAEPVIVALTEDGWTTQVVSDDRPRAHERRVQTGTVVAALSNTAPRTVIGTASEGRLKSAETKRQAAANRKRAQASGYYALGRSTVTVTKAKKSGKRSRLTYTAALRAAYRGHRSSMH